MKKCKEALQTIGRDHREGKKKNMIRRYFQSKYFGTCMKTLE